MTPSVICLAMFTNLLAVLTLMLMKRNHRRKILRLKTEHWKTRMTERKLTYDRAWKDGYGFAKAVQELRVRGFGQSHGDSQN